MASNLSQDTKRLNLNAPFRFSMNTVFTVTVLFSLLFIVIKSWESRGIWIGLFQFSVAFLLTSLIQRIKFKGSPNFLFASCLFYLYGLPYLWFMGFEFNDYKAYVQKKSGTAYEPRCLDQITNISKAIKAYYDQHQKLPQAGAIDDDPLAVSWRLKVTEIPLDSHFHRYYNFELPWHHPDNKELFYFLRQSHKCPDHNVSGNQITNYFAITGLGTVWDEGTLTNPQKPQPRIIGFESRNQSIHWVQPFDYSINEAIERILDPANHHTDFPGVMVMLSDGTATHIPNYSNPGDIRRWITEGLDFRMPKYVTRYQANPNGRSFLDSNPIMILIMTSCCWIAWAILNGLRTNPFRLQKKEE